MTATANYRIVKEITRNLPFRTDVMSGDRWRTMGYHSTERYAAESIVQRIHEQCISRPTTPDERAELKHWEELL